MTFRVVRLFSVGSERTGGCGIVVGVPRVAKSGRGSNQYHGKGRPTQRERAASLGVESAIERIGTEQVATAFAGAGAVQAVVVKVRRSTNPDVFISAAAHPDEGVRMVAAESPRCPPAVLSALASDPSEIVRKSVGSNPVTPPETLDGMLLDGVVASVGLVEAIYANPSLDPTTIEREWRSPRFKGKPFARAKLLRNPSCPPDVLRGAAAASVHERRYVAANPRCPVDILESVAADPDVLWRQRQEAMCNPSYPPERLMEYYRDSGGASKGVPKAWMLSHPDCPAVILDEVAAVEKVDRWQVTGGEHKNASDFVLHRLATASTDAYTLAVVARHPNASKETLELVLANTKARGGARTAATSRIAAVSGG